MLKCVKHEYLDNGYLNLFHILCFYFIQEYLLICYFSRNSLSSLVTLFNLYISPVKRDAF